MRAALVAAGFFCMTAHAQPVPRVSSPPADAAGWLSLAAAHPSLTFRQHWRPAPEPRLQAGEAWVFRGDNDLYLLASLIDTNIVHRGTRYNEFLFNLGDMVEVFVQPEGGEPYWEFHSDPAGLSYQARFPSLAEFSARRGKFDLDVLLAPYMLAEPLAATRAWRTPTGWMAVFTVPLAPLGDPAAARISFARYDATMGSDPAILSCTAPLAQLNFHRPGDWPVFRLR